MADLILKVAYPYRDERLFPPGWRSFSQLVYSLNHLEYANEVICINGISGPLTNEILGLNTIREGDFTNEIICVNDIDYIFKEIICKIPLEISNEIVSVSGIEGEKTREVIGINYLSEEKSREIISFNDILEVPIYTKEIAGLNRLEETTSFTEYSHTVLIYIDDILVSDYLEEWSIRIDEDSYVNSVTLTFADKSFFAMCDPANDYGEVRIKVSIDEIEYRFMLEKRNPRRDPMDGSFNVWGRSYIANLDLPYALPIIEKEVVQDSVTGEWYCPDDSSYEPYIWQTGDRLVSEIIESVIGTISLDFQIDDFIIKKGALSASGESPINMIDKLVQTIGAHIRTDLADRLVIKYWKINVTGNAVATFKDDEDIFMLDEKMDLPGGYNRVLVKGYEDPTKDVSTGLNLELDEDLNEGETTFSFGEEIWIRLYKSPFNINYDISCSLGDLILFSEDTEETITREQKGFTGETLQTDNPIITITSIERYDCTTMSPSSYNFEEGYKIVTSENSVQDEPVLISYTSKYDLYRLVINQPCDPMPYSEVLSQVTVREIT